MEFSKVEKKSITDEIVQQIVAKIVSHEWQPGDKLPSEAELVEGLAASKYSVRSALSQLNMMGLIVTEQGKGSYVRDSAEAEILKPLLATAIMDPNGFLSIAQFRCGVEPEAARRAALLRTNQDIRQLSAILKKMESTANKKKQKEYSKLDISFHVEISRISGNQLFLQSMRIVESMYKAELERVTVPTQFSSHVGIFEAIRKGDSEQAFLQMQQHIRNTEERLIQNAE